MKPSRALAAKINAALKEQWRRPSTHEPIDLNLPLPISTNDLWRPDGKGGVCRTDRYETWFRAAGNMINAQRPGRIDGCYALSLTINRRRTRIDLDNAVKAVSDALQECGVIDNDRLAEEIHLRWSDDVDGMLVWIERWTKREAA